jgi:hypothetical protein
MSSGEPYIQSPNQVVPHLLPELIDHIIDYLHDSPADLRTGALVCKAWLAPCRSHLFRSISIDPWCGYSFCCSLYAAIQQSPQIAIHVRELCCSYGNIFFHIGQSWPYENGTILPQLLHSFTELRKLKIAFICWTHFPPDIRKSFRDILALPSLVHFQIVDVAFFKPEHFMSLLRPHLKRLSVCCSDGPSDDDDDDDDDDYNDDDHNDDDLDDLDMTVQIMHEIDQEIEREAETEREPCRLQQLRLCCGQSFQTSLLIDWLLGSQSVVDLSNVHTFMYDIHRYTQDGMMRLARAAGSIECLILRFLPTDLPRAPSSSSSFIH